MKKGMSNEKRKRRIQCFRLRYQCLLLFKVLTNKTILTLLISVNFVFHRGVVLPRRQG